MLHFNNNVLETPTNIRLGYTMLTLSVINGLAYYAEASVRTKKLTVDTDVFFSSDPAYDKFRQIHLSGAIFTTLYFLCSLQMGAIS